MTINHTNPFTISSLYPITPLLTRRKYKELIPKTEPYPCVAPEGFQWKPKWELFFVDIPSSSTATTSLANKSLEELFLDTVKLNPTNKDKRKSKRVASRAEVRKLLPIRCNGGIIKTIYVVSKQFDFYIVATLHNNGSSIFVSFFVIS